MLTFAPSNASLVRQVLSGRRDRFDVLVRRHLGAVYSGAYSFTTNHADAPPIPKPVVPTDDPGATSDTMVTIASMPLADFSPWVTKARVEWDASFRKGRLFSLSPHLPPDTIFCGWMSAISWEYWEP